MRKKINNPKFIKTDKFQDNVFIPLRLSDQIIEGTLEYVIQFMVDNKIDMTSFNDKIRNEFTGRPAWNPKVLLKIVLFAYSKGIVTSRSIENLCRQNVIAMALSENSIPHFTVIADFVSGMTDEISSVFLNVLLVANEMSLLGNTTFALDGCKMQSNASKENSGTFADLEKKSKKLKEKIKYLTETHKRNDLKNTDKSAKKIKSSVKKLKTKIKKIDDFIKNNDKKIGNRYKENQSNITDNESAKMKNGSEVIQGYNGQALVDSKHQIVIAAEAFGQGSDSDLLEPLVDMALTNYKSMGENKDFLNGKTFLADTGYFSETNLKKADEMKMDAYIPDQNFRKRDPRFKDKDRFGRKKKDLIQREDFKYDKKTDTVLCPRGNRLTLSKQTVVIKNYTYKKYIGKKSFCSSCPDRKRCLRNDKTRYRVYQISLDNKGREYTKTMIDKIDTIHGRDTYSKRMGIVEPVFANIRTHKKMNRFTLRTKNKVNIQWLLFCIVHNLGKIMRYGDIKMITN